MSRLVVPIAAATLAVMSLASPADAVCVIPYQFDVADSSGSKYFYLYENGNPLTDLVGMQGSFWALGFGDPAPGVGSDNGSYSSSNWVLRFQDNVYFAGFWTDSPSIDGCVNDPPVPQPGKMVVALTRTTGGQSTVSASCVQKDAQANYRFGNIGSSIDLKPIPKPVIANASRNGNQVSLLLVPISFAGLTQTDSFCAGANLITGYKIHAKIVDRGQPPPVDRDRVTGGWVQLGGLSPTSVDVTCETDKDVFLATSLVFDSGFETPVVSANSTLVECGPNVADRPPSFRTVEKPTRRTVLPSPPTRRR